MQPVICYCDNIKDIHLTTRWGGWRSQNGKQLQTVVRSDRIQSSTEQHGVDGGAAVKMHSSVVNREKNPVDVAFSPQPWKVSRGILRRSARTRPIVPEMLTNQ